MGSHISATSKHFHPKFHADKFHGILNIPLKYFNFPNPRYLHFKNSSFHLVQGTPYVGMKRISHRVIHYICSRISHPNGHFGPKFGRGQLGAICSIPLIHSFFTPIFVSEIFVVQKLPFSSGFSSSSESSLRRIKQIHP